MNKLDVLLERDKQFSKTSLEKGAVEAYKEFLVEKSTFLPNRREPVFGINNSEVDSQLKKIDEGIVKFKEKQSEINAILTN